MKKKLRKILTLVFVSVLIISNQHTSTAATSVSKSQVQRALTSIKAEILKVNGQIDNLELGKENTLAEALAVAWQETKKVQDAYESNRKLQLEKKVSAQAKLNDLSVFKVTVDNISACGVNFQTRCEKNQTIKVPTTSSLDVGFLIKLGGFVPLDEVAYQETLKSIQDIDTEILKLDSYLPGAKANVESRYKSDVAGIFNETEIKVINKEKELKLLKSSKLAIERTLKSSGNYSVAFRNAILFENNLQGISEVADTSFENIDSLLDLSIVRNAVKLSDQGEIIKRSYSGAKAKNYNKIFGNTFLDSSYEEVLVKTSAIFKRFAK
jgi:hypothetical protein